MRGMLLCSNQKSRLEYEEPPPEPTPAVAPPPVAASRTSPPAYNLYAKQIAAPALRRNNLPWHTCCTQVKGFVTKMEECMGACDCIITKEGPGTIAEAMISGLPIILNDYIAGQEDGNVPYVVENGCGKFSISPKEIARIISEWFGPKSHELQTMSQNCLKLAKPDAVFKIVHDLHELVRQRSLIVPQTQYSVAS